MKNNEKNKNRSRVTDESNGTDLGAVISGESVLHFSEQPKTRKPANRDTLNRSKDGAKYLQSRGYRFSESKIGANEANKSGTGVMDDNDIMSLNDTVKGLSEAYTRFRQDTSSLDPNVDPNMIGSIRSERMDKALAKLSHDTATTVISYYRAVSRSTSKFYTSGEKKRAEEYASEIEQRLGDEVAGDTPARTLRMMFVPSVIMMTAAQMPAIERGQVITRDTLDELADKYALLHFLQAPIDSPNTMIKDIQDHRGSVDINTTYDLHILYINNNVKKALRKVGVSEDVVNALGNYALPIGENIANTGDMTASTFIDLGETYDESAATFKDWAGPLATAPMLTELFGYIQDFKLKAHSIVGTDPADVEYNGAHDSNLFSPDLAVKFWIQMAFNAVYKVLVEDGTGTFDRVIESMFRNSVAGVGARMYDVAATMLNTNYEFLQGMKTQSEKFLVGKQGAKFRYSPTVYEYVKANWAPIIRKKEAKTCSRYLGDNKLPNEQITISIIPKLILPCNPYDNMVPVYEDNMTKSSMLLGLEPEDRSILFKSVTLPHAYIDPRNRTEYRDLNLFFDNMFSYFMFNAYNTKRFNAHSYHAKPLDDNQDDFIAKLHSIEWKGPHTIHGEVGEGIFDGKNIDNALFHGELYASDIDRLYKLGLQYGDTMPVLDQLTVTFNAKDENYAVQRGNDRYMNDYAAMIPMFYTNPIAFRFASMTRWALNHPAFLGRIRDIGMSMTRFIEGVFDGKMNGIFGVPSKSFIEAKTFSSSPLSKTIDIRDAFRYSVVEDGVSNGRFLGIVDNESLKKPLTFLRCCVSTEDGKVTREITPMINRANTRAAISKEDSIKSLNELAGHFGFMSGLDITESSKKLGSLYLITSYKDKTIDELMEDTPEWMYKASRYQLDPTGAIIINTPKYGNYHDKSRKKYVCYNKRLYPSAFTKSLCVNSEQTYFGDVDDERDDMKSGSLVNTWGNALFINSIDDDGTQSIFDNWVNMICSWNTEYPDLTLYEADSSEFRQLVRSIFHPFPQVNHEVMALDHVRYSPSVCAVVGTASNPDTENSTCLNARYYITDPSRQYVTSIAHVFGPSIWSDLEETETLMSILGQKCLDVVATSTNTHLRGGEQGFVVDLRHSQIPLDYYRSFYKSPIPNLEDRDNYIDPITD